MPAEVPGKKEPFVLSGLLGSLLRLTNGAALSWRCVRVAMSIASFRNEAILIATRTHLHDSAAPLVSRSKDPNRPLRTNGSFLPGTSAGIHRSPQSGHKLASGIREKVQCSRQNTSATKRTKRGPGPAK